MAAVKHAAVTKHACIVEADESMRIRQEGAPYRYHEEPTHSCKRNKLIHSATTQA